MSVRSRGSVERDKMKEVYEVVVGLTKISNDAKKTRRDGLIFRCFPL